MRRFVGMAGTVKAANSVGASLQGTRAHGHAHGEDAHPHAHDHGHSHSGGGGHGHSHGSIEASVKGRDLFACKLATAVGGATNVFFGVTKLYVGSSGGSVALMADGFHSVTDIAADIVSYFSISMADKKLPRCRYPFGMGRLETSGAVIVAAILFFGGVALLIQSFASCVRDVGVYMSGTAEYAALSAVLTSLAYRFGAPQNATASGSSSSSHDGHDHDDHDHPDHGHAAHEADSHAAHGHSHDGAHGHSHFTLIERDSLTGQQVILWSMVMLAASSVVVKELLYHWTKRVGKRAGSRVVVANAYHHRADAWSGGVALLGVLGTCVGLPGIDGAAGCFVSLSICKIGYSLFKGSVLEFFDSQNVDDLAGVRAQLQEFHVSVNNGTVTMAANVGEGSSLSASSGTQACAATAADVQAPSSAVDTQRIRFVNVFLMRHGHNYVLYVTLLAHEDVTAAQLESATHFLTALARKSLPVEMTYTTVQVCQGDTVPKDAYLSETRSQEEATHTGKAAVPSCVAIGAVVNPSLEKIIHEHHLFHGAETPLTYDWEKREMQVTDEYCADCLSDAESIASMFHLRLVASSRSAHHD